MYSRDGEAVAQLAQTGGGCPIPDAALGVPADCKGVRLDGLQG